MSRPIIPTGYDLTASDEALIAAAARGVVVDLEGERISGAVVRALLNGENADWPAAQSGLRIYNAIIAGGIDLEGCTARVPLLLTRVRIEDGERGALVVRDGRLKRLSLQDCLVDGALVADRAQFENGILFAGGRIEGEVFARGVQVSGAWSIEGTRIGTGRESIKANGLRLSGPLILRRARLVGDVQLERAQLGSGLYAENLQLDGKTAGRAFNMEGARVTGDLLLASARLTNGLRIAHARIEGRMAAEGAQIAASEIAVEGEGVSVGQGVTFGGAKVEGVIDLSGADIGKGLLAEAIEIDGGSTAILAGGISVGGNWDLARAKIVGAINCPGAEIRGQFRLTEARLFGAELAIRADGARIGGGCYMSRSMVFGLLRFPACEIGNQFRLRGASLKVEAGAALMVNGSRFGRDVELNSGLQSIGALVLDQVRIPGVLDLTDSRVKSAALARDGRPRPGDEASANPEDGLWDEAALSLADADVKRLCMPMKREDRPRGIVDLSRARAASFHDYADTWTPGPAARGRASDGRDIDHLVLDGFVYEHLNNPAGTPDEYHGGGHRHADDRVGERRQQWLDGQQACDIREHFKPQPWVQLETRLLQQGYDDASRQISISRRRLERSSHATRTLERWQGAFLDLFALYGFNPWRTVAWMVAFVVIFAGIWAWAGGQCTKSGCSDESVFVMTNRDAYSADKFDEVYPSFNPLAYSFDVFVPFVSFGYADHWRPNLSWNALGEIPQPFTFSPVGEGTGTGERTANDESDLPTIRLTMGGVLYALVIAETIIGIVLTSLLITGFTGLLRGD